MNNTNINKNGEKSKNTNKQQLSLIVLLFYVYKAFLSAC